MNVESMTVTNLETGVTSCINCHSLIAECRCIWAAIRELQRTQHISVHNNDIIKLLANKINDFDKYRKLQCQNNQTQAQQIKDLSESVTCLGEFIESNLKMLKSHLFMLEQRIANRTNTQIVQDANIYSNHVNELNKKIAHLEQRLTKALFDLHNANIHKPLSEHGVCCNDS